MIGVIDNLKSFNRKERFFFVGMALGNPNFELSPGFRVKLNETLRLDVPEDAFTAMDYHLDWIYASLFLFFNGNADGVYPNSDKKIKATQQDVDLLVGYQEDERACHIIMLEAKGVTGWTNAQMKSKARRLRDIFGENGNKRPGIIPHFALVSPKEPQRLDAGSWPAWMKPDNKVDSLVKTRFEEVPAI